jgi:hypothetical protein
VTEPTQPDTRHEVSAKHALNGYRERRRRRRGEDTYFGSADCLVRNVQGAAGEADRERRRSEILEDAEKVGMPVDLAEKLYVIAGEEGLDPELAFELVHSGLGVCPPEDGITNAPSEPTADKYLPEWMFPPVAPDDLLRERTLRMSFRRLRSLLERHPEVDDAFRAFASEPDVGYPGY